MIMVLILILSLIVFTESQLTWQLYDNNGNIINNNTIYVGYYGAQLRLVDQSRALFQTVYTIITNQNILPAFPQTQLNSAQLNFYIGSTSTNTFTFSPTASNGITLPSISLNVIFQACVIVPSNDFQTAMYGSKAMITLDFSKCMPISTLSVKASYYNLTQTQILQNSTITFQISITSNSTLNVTFSSNYYYSIQPISLLIIAQDSTTPKVSSLVGPTECTPLQASIYVTCSKNSLLYYQYYYTNQISFQNLKYYINQNPLEGVGMLQAQANSTYNIAIGPLKSNTIYSFIAYCQDQMYQYSSLSQSIQRCNQKVQILKYTFGSYSQLNTINKRDIVCDLMILYQISYKQISTSDGIFCDLIAQSKYNGQKSYQSLPITNNLTNYSIYIYPDYTSDTTSSLTALNIQHYNSTPGSITYFGAQNPIIKQEFATAANNLLNFTIALKTPGYLYIGLDTSVTIPTINQMKSGLNSLGYPFINFKQLSLQSGVHNTQSFLISDNQFYYLYFLTSSDPSIYAQTGSVQQRSFNMIKQSVWSILYMLNLILIINL